MKLFTHVVLLGVVAVAAFQPAGVQPVAAQENAKTEERARPAVSVKVQIVFSEYDGDKKISSMPYSLVAIPEGKTGRPYSTSLRTGVRIPTQGGGTEQKTTYLDTGSNIDCRIVTESDDRYQVYLIFERSALYGGSGGQEEKMQGPSRGGAPLIRQFKASVYMVLKDGQSVDTVVATDPVNGHSQRISTTINVMK